MNASAYRLLLLVAIVVLWISANCALGQPSQASIEAIKQYTSAHGAEMLLSLNKLVELPNVSRDQQDVRKNAEFLAGEFTRRGATMQLLEIPGANPVVYGEMLVPGATRTAIIYIHYDGQPVAPAKWQSTSPFKPALYSKAITDGGKRLKWPVKGQPLNLEWRVYGRSTSDDKAPFVALLAAIDALKARSNSDDTSITSNIKFFFDGEEEIGSPNMRRVLDRYSDKFRDIDLWVFCDGPLHQSRKPTLYYGVRGITGMEITVYGAARNLHSGHYGNWAPNPGLMLSRLLSGMKDAQGKVLVKGFYDDVVPLTKQELAALRAVPRIDDALRDELGLVQTENNNQPYLERMQLPSLNIRGVECGTVGRAARNIVPNQATASIDIRLVKGNEPRKMLSLVEQHIRDQGYAIVRTDPDMKTRKANEKIAKVTVRHNSYPAARTSMEHRQLAPLVMQLERFIGEQELLQVPSLGGSLPLYLISDYLDQPLVILPIANHDNNQHAPDENLRVGNLIYGVQAMAAVLTMEEP